MDKGDIPFLSATELAGLIKSREVSPVEAVEAYLERIELLDGQLNSYLTVCHDEARQAARESEQTLARGEYRGAMHGIPVAVKDQLYTQGVRTTGGSLIFKDFVPDEDATVMARLKAAGAILLGKLSMPEFASAGPSHRFKTPSNPWNLEHYPGGSSTGSGAATAGFLCATSLGEDTGGSIRCPAAWCGLVGLRPSWGRVSRYGLMAGTWSMDTVGPISRTVADCAMTLQAIAGYDPKDPYTWNVPVPDYRQALTGNIKGLRVGVVKELHYSEVVEPEVREAVGKATNVMAELGASVEEVSIPLSSYSSAISGAHSIESAIHRRELVRDRLRELDPKNQVGYLARSLIPAQAYYKAQKLRSLLRQQVLDVLERVDVLALPTVGTVAPKGIDGYDQVTSRPGFWNLTSTFSKASAPALSVCCGFSAENLPIGLQIVGRPFDEEMVLKVAHAYEQSTLWHTRKPPL